MATPTLIFLEEDDVGVIGFAAGRFLGGMVRSGVGRIEVRVMAPEISACNRGSV